MSSYSGSNVLLKIKLSVRFLQNDRYHLIEIICSSTVTIWRSNKPLDFYTIIVIVLDQDRQGCSIMEILIAFIKKT